jgi:hypothetical protein
VQVVKCLPGKFQTRACLQKHPVKMPSRNGSATEDEDEIDKSSNWNLDEVIAGRNDGSLCSCC